MRLDTDEVAGLRNRHRMRRQRLLRRTFAARDPDTSQREAYFDAWNALAEGLEGMSEPDVLCLLEIGFHAGVPLSETEAYRCARTRGRWYGRRLWIWDHMERRGLTRFQSSDLEKTHLWSNAQAS